MLEIEGQYEKAYNELVGEGGINNLTCKAAELLSNRMIEDMLNVLENTQFHTHCHCHRCGKDCLLWPPDVQGLVVVNTERGHHRKKRKKRRVLVPKMS